MQVLRCTAPPLSRSQFRLLGLLCLPQSASGDQWMTSYRAELPAFPGYLMTSPYVPHAASSSAMSSRSSNRSLPYSCSRNPTTKSSPIATPFVFSSNFGDASWRTASVEFLLRAARDLALELARLWPYNPCAALPVAIPASFRRSPRIFWLLLTWVLLPPSGSLLPCFCFPLCLFIWSHASRSVSDSLLRSK